MIDDRFLIPLFFNAYANVNAHMRMLSFENLIGSKLEVLSHMLRLFLNGIYLIFFYYTLQNYTKQKYTNINLKKKFEIEKIRELI